MKKICFLLLIMVIFSASIPVFAQETSNSKINELYTKTFQVVKIYSNRFGYMLAYWTPGGKIAEMYIPLEWFEGAASKAVLVYGKSAELPYFAVTWKNGEFTNITVYAYDNFSHPTWGILKGTDDQLKSKFEVENLNIQF
ncbi:MAG: hypothetical protein JW904_04255 [Spirochaetales bacterium]|nr:hypothetical protein [Spirochaetales bacterium]